MQCNPPKTHDIYEIIIDDAGGVRFIYSEGSQATTNADSLEKNLIQNRF